MIRTILVAIIAIMLFAMPVMGFAPHDCDVAKNDNLVDYHDIVEIERCYGTYFPYIHWCDLNRDFNVNIHDKMIAEQYLGANLHDISGNMIAGYIHVENTVFYKLYENNGRAWITEWSCVNHHIYQEGYVCRHFAWDIQDSFEDDYGYDGMCYVHNYGLVHAYNAFLIGDNPLYRGDWLFTQSYPRSGGVESFWHDYNGHSMSIKCNNRYVWFETGEIYGRLI